MYKWIIGFLSLGFCLASCGVKKNPDAYYAHPLQFDDAPAPSASPTPGVVGGFNS